MAQEKAESYDVAVRAHLARYKRESLGVLADGIWARNGRSYPHILPAEDKWLNILEPIRGSLRDYLSHYTPPIRLHRDFHHLSSSQAMAFNLFQPWFANERGSVFLAALALQEEEPVAWDYEKVLDVAELTNLDFWVRRRDGSELHFEIKFTERSFGRAKEDSAHMTKLSGVYRPRIARKIRPATTDTELLGHYQLMRLVSGMDIARGDKVIVIAPAAHSAITHEIREFRKLLTPDCSAALRFVSLESIITALSQRSDLKSAEVEYLRLFARKYLLQITPE